jgi:hypothetical protein
MALPPGVLYPTVIYPVTTFSPAPTAIVATVQPAAPADSVAPAVLPDGSLIFAQPTPVYPSGSGGKIGVVMPGGGIATPTSGGSAPVGSIGTAATVVPATTSVATANNTTKPDSPYMDPNLGPSANPYGGSVAVMPDGTLGVSMQVRGPSSNTAKLALGAVAVGGLLWWLSKRK